MDWSEEFNILLQLLEEKFLYQDRMIDTLNDVIIAQQDQLASVGEELERLKTMLAALENSPTDRTEDPTPPHY